MSKGKLIEKAVDLWCGMLVNYKFDNGDTSDNRDMSIMLATMNANSDKDKIADFPAEIEKFRANCIELVAEKIRNGRNWLSLSCDYNPCGDLRTAIEGTQIQPGMFSCKTDVHIDDDHVSISAGYGAQHINYYPTDTGKWLITKSRIHKDELSEFISAVLDGRLRGIPIE